MFLICHDKAICKRSLSKFVAHVGQLTCGPIQLVELNDHWLGWARCKPHENFHKFNDCIVIGKLNFAELPDDDIKFHDENLPNEIHPLATGLSIVRKGDYNIIHPFNITSIYYGRDSVSDMQLLCAEAEGYKPSPEGVAILSTIGFFPGNLTLFSEIKRIPFLTDYNYNTKQLTNQASFNIKKPDDQAMIERLISIIPDHPHHYLGMSSGYDCRFILGILLKSGVSPHLIHVASNDLGDTANVEKISQQLNLSCTKLSSSEMSYLPSDIYTLSTDAQIYFRGGSYSCVRHSIKRESIYYTGTIPAGTIRYYPMVRVKIPGPMGKIYHEFIDHLLISNRDIMTNGLREINSIQKIKDYLLEELSFGNDYCSFKTKSELANWLFFVHKGIRWSPAFLADLSYFTQPVYLLTDIEALSLGISSGVWLNFRNDRLREFNAALLPEVKVPYSDGTTYMLEKGISNYWDKIKYEYGDRLKAYYFNPKAQVRRLSDRNKIPAPLKKNVFSFKDVNFHAKDFTQYFTDDFEKIISGSAYSYWLKRAAVTVGYSLQFLGN